MKDSPSLVLGTGFWIFVLVLLLIAPPESCGVRDDFIQTIKEIHDVIKEEE